MSKSREWMSNNKSKNRTRRENRVVVSKSDCPKCSTVDKFERRKWIRLADWQIKNTYYFSEWDYCTACGFVQHYEEYKVYNDPKVQKLMDEGSELDNRFFNM